MFTSSKEADQDNEYLVNGSDITYVADVDSDYSVAFGYVYVPYTRWVETYHADKTGHENWDDMLADRDPDVIWNVYDLDYKTDDAAETTSFEDGQQAVIVYDKTNLKVKAAWVIADVDDEIVVPDKPAGSLITNTTIDGWNASSAKTYGTIDKAIENAAEINLGFFQTAQPKIDLTLSKDVATGYVLKYATMNAAEDCTDDDFIMDAAHGLQNWNGTTLTGTLTENVAVTTGNTYVLKLTTTSGDVVYAAYTVVVK